MSHGFQYHAVHPRKSSDTETETDIKEADSPVDGTGGAGIANAARDQCLGVSILGP
jgi:hypothetical protein